MWQKLEEEIERKARKVLAKHRTDLATRAKYAARFTKRTGVASTANLPGAPAYWTLDSHFDPVYCISHARFLAKGIWGKVQAGTYKPKPAIQFQIEKPDGGVREIMSFSIPDSALANILHRALTNRNSGLFSAYSFAYRPDKNLFEAIIHLHRMMQPSKTFILQYDYRKYFDTINHNYLDKLIERQSFVLSNAERNAISAFLKHRFAPYASYQTRNWEKREIGVPQGSSLSLFLSNIAAHDLDMELERLNGSFVRFADDVIAVAHTYDDARAIELQFRAHCERSGVQINFEKSSGISMIEGRSSDDKRDFFVDGSDGGNLKKLHSVNFLGHNIAPSAIDLTQKAIKRIKRRISRIIYIHLLQQPRNGQPINPQRLGGDWIDWDLVTCINELRRYIYGGLSEWQLENFIENDKKLPFVRGLMSFYPLVSKHSNLSMLDGWLLSVLKRAITERSRLITVAGLLSYKVDIETIINGNWYQNEIENETRLPSFVRAWRAARKFYKRYGLTEVQAPGYYSVTSLYN